MNEIIHWHDPELVLNQQHALLYDTVVQIKKDFLQNGLALELTPDAFRNTEEVLAVLEQSLGWLLERDAQRLMQLLYRIDLGEDKLKASMLQNEHDQLCTLLAKLILRREAQKVLMRYHFKSKSSDETNL